MSRRPSQITNRLAQEIYNLDNILEFSRNLNSASNLKKIADSILLTGMADKGIEVIALLLAEQGLPNIFTLRMFQRTKRELEGKIFPISSTLVRQLNRTSHIILNNTLEAENPATGKMMSALQCQLLLPVLHQDRLRGILCCRQKLRSKKYTEEDEQLFQLISLQTGVAINNILTLTRLERSKAQLNRKVAELEAVEEISRALLESIELSEVAHNLLHSVTRYLGTSSGSLYVFDANHPHHLELVGQQGLNGTEIPKHVCVEENAAHLLRNQPVLSTSINLPDSLRNLWDKVDAGIGFPLNWAGQTLGLCLIGNKTGISEYQPSEVDVAALLVQQAVAPIHNSQLYLQLKEYNRDLQQKVEARTHELQQANEELRQAHERMAKELESAALLQKTMLPQAFPLVPGIELDHFFQAATETGGDWFDYIHVKDHLIILIGDVTGHGMSAAMVTAAACTTCFQLQQLYTLYTDFQLTPAFILEQLNYTVFKAAQRKYLMTFFVASLNLRTGELRFANAAHNFPLLCRAQRPLGHLVGSGVHLGAAAHSTYQEERLFLKKDDLLIFYTDGLIDNTNPQGKNFGMRQMRRFFQKEYGKNAHELAKKLCQESQTFYDNHPLEDDITFVVLRVAEDFREPPT